jgi:hypothetical protein
MKLIGTDQDGNVLFTSLASINEGDSEIVTEVEDDLEVYPNCTMYFGNQLQVTDQEMFDDQRSGKWNEIRLIRNNVIATTDWTQLGDSALTTDEVTAWQTYRTELRDMIDEDTNPFAVVWPTEPS